MLRVLDLFSGIGGFSLGLERTGGFRTVAFCEQDRYCRWVLEKHWPGVAKFRDVRFLDRRKLANFMPIDAICGGFPCQDISIAGAGAGIEGERSGLWGEYARLVGELRPRYVIVENVAALLGRGLSVVLGDLAALGYDAEWHCIPAAAVGAPHIRDRIWIVAYPGRECGAVWREAGYVVGAEGAGERDGSERERHGDATYDRCAALADADSQGQADVQGRCQVPKRPRYGALIRRGIARRRRDGWSPEPAVGRVANGVPGRVDRLGALGNSLVPVLPEILAEAILAAEEAEGAFAP
jgi:DNA (cytosine-5)-methyltransferase 1